MRQTILKYVLVHAYDNVKNYGRYNSRDSRLCLKNSLIG